MTANTRLIVSLLIILSSGAYAIVVVQSPQVATAISGGYVAALLTVFVIVNVWKKP